jgi:pantothenate synthetase
VACPTVREPDGLAMSSRNARLSEGERAIAPVLYEALRAMDEAARGGERSSLKLAILGAVIVKRAKEIELEYLQVIDPETLEPLEVAIPGARAIIAATIGNIRLIDNIALLDGES